LARNQPPGFDPHPGDPWHPDWAPAVERPSRESEISDSETLVSEDEGDADWWQRALTRQDGAGDPAPVPEAYSSLEAVAAPEEPEFEAGLEEPEKRARGSWWRRGSRRRARSDDSEELPAPELDLTPDDKFPVSVDEPGPPELAMPPRGSLWGSRREPLPEPEPVPPVEPAAPSSAADNDAVALEDLAVELASAAIEAEAGGPEPELETPEPELEEAEATVEFEVAAEPASQVEPAIESRWRRRLLRVGVRMLMCSLWARLSRRRILLLKWSRWLPTR
jgi:hypothetical protein